MPEESTSAKGKTSELWENAIKMFNYLSVKSKVMNRVGALGIEGGVRLVVRSFLEACCVHSIMLQVRKEYLVGSFFLDCW